MEAAGRGGGRAALAVRGADRARRGGDEPSVQEFGTESFAESLTYFPEPDEYRTGPERYLDYIGEAKKAVTIPIIASLNGTSKGGWVRYAKLMQDAGADALELNVYFVATDLDMTGPRTSNGGISIWSPP